MVENQELLATPAGEDCGGANVLAENVCSGLQDLVACRVSQAVIDHLEVIEVAQTDGQVATRNSGNIADSIALEFGDPRLNGSLYVAAIAEVCERVGDRSGLQLRDRSTELRGATLHQLLQVERVFSLSLFVLAL